MNVRQLSVHDRRCILDLAPVELLTEAADGLCSRPLRLGIRQETLGQPQADRDMR